MDVEKDQQSPGMFKSSIEAKVEPQYLCQFTMLLMDTVEELTVRVSQIDFVCRQHFPDFQSLSQSIQKKILGFNKSELEWRKKEDSFLSRIHELESKNQCLQSQMDQMNSSLEETRIKLMNKEQLLKQCELEKIEFLEQLVQKDNEAIEAKGIEEDLLKQIELKDKKMEVELSKKRSSFEEYSRLRTNYKHLKSQYNFLLTKFGNGMANILHSNIMEDENGRSTSCLNKRCDEDMKNNNIAETSLHPPQIIKSKTVIPHQKECFADNLTLPEQSTDDTISIKQGLIPPKPPPRVKTEPNGSSKLSNLRWRDTRTRQELKAGDPHDDFLDTPIENVQNTRQVKENLSSPANEEGNCSDETLDINPEIVSRKHAEKVIGPLNKKFKYVEPVKKKVERDNLKGVECQQCKRFYDAVLPPDGGKGTAAIRCEHHDGVSRHRYKHAPPMTPEGFWNIGFDSDL